MSVMKSKVFIDKLVDVAKNHKTLYVMGCFGAPMSSANKTRYIKHHSYNQSAARVAMINAASANTFGFDCVCLIKAILWGWNGNTSKTYGGAGYAINGVPDVSADGMIRLCKDVKTTGWDSMIPGEAVWCSGHIGIYIGNGLAVECTPRWTNNVQITAVGNIGNKTGYNARVWTKHGKLPYIDYSDQKGTSTPTVTPSQTTTTNVKVAGTVSTGSAADEKSIYDYLYVKIGNHFGVSGLMGNLFAESGLRSNNLQNTYEKKLGYTDSSYTEAVDVGKYANFVKDQAGYGLAQWTFWSRKQNLLKFAQSAKKSIGDWKMQCDFLMKELSESYPAVLKALKAATSVRAASDEVLLKFERPANQDESVKKKRAEYGQKYYDKYAKSASITANPSTGATQVVAALKKGDIVNFIGNTHYSNPNAATPKKCKPGKAKITENPSMKGKHPYHLVAISGGGSNVYGWVNAVDIAEAISVKNNDVLPRNVRVTVDSLRVRMGPGTEYGIAHRITDRGVYQIVEVTNGWGKLNTGGWISLEYTKDV